MNTKFFVLVMFSLSGDTLFSLENKNIVDISAEVHTIVGNYVFLIFIAYRKWLPLKVSDQNLWHER